AKGVPAGAPARSREAGPRRGRTLRRLGPRDDPAALYAEAVSAALAAGLGAIVVVPEVREGSGGLERLERAVGGEGALVHSVRGPGGLAGQGRRSSPPAGRGPGCSYSCPG